VSYWRQCYQRDPVREGPSRRGFAGQRLERVQEETARRHVVEAGKDLQAAGWHWSDTADFFHLAPRTLRHWRHNWSLTGARMLPLGRPIQAADRQERNAVIDYLDEWGPAVGLPTLQMMFPALARAALVDILRRYRRVWRRLHRQPMHVLHWLAPGRVWAIDFHGPRPAIDGLYPHLLAVRDLTSHQQLTWLPVRDMTAATVLPELTSLFKVHGAPLVLKSDNGSAFGDTQVQALCGQFGVRNLFSPPRTPRYNGAIEAGIGSLTSRTEYAAARRGCPDDWTYDDVALARWEANATARPGGMHGPCPDELWTARTAITLEERKAFQQTVHWIRIALELESQSQASFPLPEMEERAIDREAISRALVEHGYLRYTRRRIYPPIRKQKAAGIM
jgi:transposase InsO family protein